MTHRNDRISTGNAQADAILGGGFPASSINIVMGQPGTGKSVFVERLVFHHATGDRPILYLTTLSEPLPKVLKYLQRFSFYDPDRMGTAIRFDDVGPELAEGGITALLPRIIEMIDTVAPKILVIDSFRALHDLADSMPEMRRMLYELTGTLTAYEMTAFLIGEYTDEDARAFPEFAVADGIVQFLRQPHSTRDERFLRVLKLRGSGYVEGLHAFRITSGGLEVFPRLVSPQIPVVYAPETERIPTGTQGLDEMFCGGLWRGSTTMVAGPSGSGKTTVALQFALEGVTRGESVLYVNFQENPIQLARAVHALGYDIEDVRARGMQLMYSSPVELQIDSVIVSLFERIRVERIQRVVLDSIGDLTTASGDLQRVNDYLYALVQHFAVSGVTAILTCETGSDVMEAEPSLAGVRCSYMSDNILLLGLAPGELNKRPVTLLKSRGTPIDLTVRELTMDGSGIRVR